MTFLLIILWIVGALSKGVFLAAIGGAVFDAVLGGQHLRVHEVSYADLKAGR